MTEVETREPSRAVRTFFERVSGDFSISTDPGKLQMDAICGFLSRSYWANGRPRGVIERSVEHSLCFGVYCIGGIAQPTLGERANTTYKTYTTYTTDAEVSAEGLRQVGFARVVTDYATFAWLC